MQKCSTSTNGYNLCELLGRGAYGTVYKALKKGTSREVVAIKCIERKSVLRTKASEDALINEIGLLKTLRHANIVELRDFSWDDKYIYLILEFCPGHDLSKFLLKYNKLSETVTQHFLRQLADAMHFLRRYNISHFDLKPQNILLTAAPVVRLKLADFGFARFLSSGDAIAGYKGTPLYMAPEMMLYNRCVPESDLWSIGVILYECLFGRVPFFADSLSAMVTLIGTVRQVHLAHSLRLLISNSCADLLCKLLQANPNARIGFDNFFRHPFIGILPTTGPSDLERGKLKITQAMDADRLGDYAKAVVLYSQGVELILSYVGRLPAVEKSKFTPDIAKYLQRAEQLKHAGTVSTADTAKPAIVDTEQTLQELWPDNAVIKACVLLAEAARMAVADENYRLAVEKYDLVITSAKELLAGAGCSKKSIVLGENLQRWSSERNDCQSMVESCLQNEVKLKNNSTPQDCSIQ